MHLAIDIIEAFQELLDAYHGMRAVEPLQLLEILDAEIVHGDHIALAGRVDAFHTPEVHMIAFNIPIHSLDKEIQAVEIIMERTVAIPLLRAECHHSALPVVVAEAQIVVIQGILCEARDRIQQIKPQRNMAGNHHLVGRKNKLRSLHFHDFALLLAEMENRLVIDAAKHLHLIAHHAYTAFIVNVFHQVRDEIIRAIGPDAGIHRLFIGRVDEDFVFITTKDILAEMPPLVENDRVDAILRTAQIERVEVGQGDIHLIGSDVETRPVRSASCAFPMVVLKIKDASGVLNHRLVLCGSQH